MKDGFGFRREQRAHPELNCIPVVICSAHYDARMHAAALEAIPAAPGDALADLDSLSRIIRTNCLKRSA